MKVLIVEDETVAYENLAEILKKTDPSIVILGNTESIQQTINWFNTKDTPDLIFMDIHLSDGNAFAIFQHITLEIPVIFTTAFDNYAIDAFKVNSIDYLLKPLKEEELSRAIQKFKKLSPGEELKYITNQQFLKPPYSYIGKMLVRDNNKLIPIDIKDVSCFYTTDKTTEIYLTNGQHYPYGKTLEQIFHDLNPKDFIRANKQFILSRECIEEILIRYDNRLQVKLRIKTPETVYVSKNKAAEFKSWFTQLV
ncbi:MULTISPECIES: LytR/AlgR family response regulator transcription factor [unclassified Saccharicrinis]|uniref:LytR/AlgR family response regulator transcription factor n=1 Tax=unclassified Saccharicrinis TaxID=2646859 RepID=UPI003D34433D